MHNYAMGQAHTYVMRGGAIGRKRGGLRILRRADQTPTPGAM
jgi:hypothetical protein